MPLAFLSHSSKQKPFVEKVADNLKSLSIIDSNSFEQGMQNTEEIVTLVKKCDVFVLFISNESLDSAWVNNELSLAKELLNNEELDRIYPLIIDSTINYKDKRLPLWLSQQYNLQLVLRTGKVVRLIRSRLREVAWKKHPRLRLREELFVGRNTDLSKVEERLDDVEKPMPFALIASGVPKIGRKTFLRKALVKSNTVFRESVEHPTIYLDTRESIEDFIIKLYDIGVSEEMDFPNFLETSVNEKVNLAMELIKDIRKSKEIVFVEDFGSIVLPDGAVSNWFWKILQSINRNTSEIIFCISSRFRVKAGATVNNNMLYHNSLTVLSKKETLGLLKRLSDLYELKIDASEMKDVVELLNGFPEQVYHAISFIDQSSVKELLKNPNVIRDYNKEVYSKIINEVEADSSYKSVLSLLVEFDFISFELLSEILQDEETEDLNIVLADLSHHSLIDFLGSNKEYFKLNEGIKDYLLRSGYKLSPDKKQKLKHHIEKYLETDSLVNSDISDFFYSLKGALTHNYKLQNKLLLPSHYLKTMIYMYERKKNYKDVIVLADKVMESEQKIDHAIAKEIKYWLCLSLARSRSTRFLDEVQYFNHDSDYYFLFGFYYRLIGKLEYALNQLENALELRPRFSRAQREIVQVLIGLEQYREAFEQARFNYENDTTNPYHIMAYLDCILRSENPTEYKDTIDELLSELSYIESSKAKEMLLVAKADYEIYYRGNQEEALSYINQAMGRFGNTLSLLGRKFSIVEKSRNIEAMEEVLGDYQKEMKTSDTQHVQNHYFAMKSKFLAHKGNLTQAINVVTSQIKFYPEGAKERLINYLGSIKPRH